MSVESMKTTELVELLRYKFSWLDDKMNAREDIESEDMDYIIKVAKEFIKQTDIPSHPDL